MIMELGDRTPRIGCEDDDLLKAVQNVAFGSNVLRGQVCFGTERVYVQFSVAEKFDMIFVESLKHFPSAGDATSEARFKNTKATIPTALPVTVPNSRQEKVEQRDSYRLSHP